MFTNTVESNSTTSIILQILGVAANEAWQDRRTDFRLPFFRPVLITTNDRTYSAFSRDISPTAIGLIHTMELPEGEVKIALPIKAGATGELRARIVRCESCGHGWYTSGGEFFEINIAPTNA